MLDAPRPAGDSNAPRHAAALLQVEQLAKYFPLHRGGLLRKTIGFVHAVDNISFSIQRGQTYALVGESGCGKTTTARVVLHLETPTRGRVLLDGEPVHLLRGPALRRYRMRVQAVFQDPWGALNPRIRIRDAVAEPLVVNQSVTRTERVARVEEALVQVGLRPSQANLYPHEFSGGQRQRVALASALIAEPDLIVLDEPVSALDVSVQAQVMNLLKRIQQHSGIAYLLVAHQLATVRYLAHTVGVMYSGELVEEASTEAVFRRPLHPYTQGLFSAALPTHPDARRDQPPIEGEVASPIDPKPGCRFRARCPFAMPRCGEESPAMREPEPGHTVACHLY